MANTKKVIYAEPSGYFPKSVMDKINKQTKSTTKKTVKKPKRK